MDVEKIHNIDPKYWGNHSWIFLNSLGMVYNPNLKNEYKNFFELLSKLLPCSKCKKHLNSNLDTLSESLDNKISLLKWLLKVRNNVPANNKKLNLNNVYNEIFYDNKTFECIDVCEIPSNKSINNKKNNYFFIVLIIMFFVLVFYIVKKYFKNLKKNQLKMIGNKK